MAAKRTPTLRKYLAEMDAEALREELERLVAKFPEVKKFYLADLSGDTSSMVQAAQKQIARSFQTSTGKWRRARSSKLNSIQRDFEAISVYKEDILALLFFRLEHTAPYLNHFKPTTSPMLAATVRIFERACELSQALLVTEKYQPLLKALIPRFDDQYLRRDLKEVFDAQFPDA
ncbi:MAG: hypothetical protein EOP52_00135 [Sphingobacteriales bacterium]|nr:MAG: hypothetical protein EOP52_00135 [Sphingobacteriales bacterium]